MTISHDPVRPSIKSAMSASFPMTKEAPLRPLGGRARGTARSDGRVRWVAVCALESAPSPLPSPPMEERGKCRLCASPVSRDKARAVGELGGALHDLADPQ